MSEERPGGSIRIGDRERDDAVRRLGEHYEAGRLTAEEHSERVEQALLAKTDAELGGLFADLPGTHQAADGGDDGGEGWPGPWGWRKPPWTAPENAASATGAGGPGGYGPGGSGSHASDAAGGYGPGGAGGYGPAGRRGWVGGAWAGEGSPGFLGRVPVPLLVVLGVLGVVASVGCVVGGGHPPVLPIALIVAAVAVIRKRRMERRA